MVRKCLMWSNCCQYDVLWFLLSWHYWSIFQQWYIGIVVYLKIWCTCHISNRSDSEATVKCNNCVRNQLECLLGWPPRQAHKFHRPNTCDTNEPFHRYLRKSLDSTSRKIQGKLFVIPTLTLDVHELAEKYWHRAPRVSYFGCSIF